MDKSTRRFAALMGMPDHPLAIEFATRLYQLRQQNEQAADFFGGLARAAWIHRRATPQRPAALPLPLAA